MEKLSKVNVLVLDGGAKAATLIKNIFGALGFDNIHTATDGFEGVQIMKKTRIHVVFADWELKIQNVSQNAANESSQNIAPVNGAVFVERLRKSPLSPNPFIPVIMMMDKSSGKEVVAARDSGVNEILLRPVDAHEFCERLVSIIDNPRPFITANTYKGPCRRKKNVMNTKLKERRVREVRLIKSITR